MKPKIAYRFYPILHSSKVSIFAAVNKSCVNLLKLPALNIKLITIKHPIMKPI
jgi:hypothetical protein